MGTRGRTSSESFEDNQSNSLVDVVRQPSTGESQDTDWAAHSDVQEAVRRKVGLLNMGMNTYQVLALMTRGDFGGQDSLMAFSALEITAEAGEVSNLTYKYLFQKHDMNRDKIIEELGDVLWGIASMADAIGVSMNDVAYANINKLRKRYPNGKFNTADSVARRDHSEEA